MKFIDIVRKRLSIRKYKPDPVPEEKIEYVLESARLAPSWGNKQCWKYIVIKDESTRKRLGVREWVAEAPVIIVGCADPEQSGYSHGIPYYAVDFAISMEHLVLAAAELGLGTCWIGKHYEEDRVKNLLGIPDNIKVVALTPLGYPDEEPEPRDRKSIQEISTKDHW